MNAPPDTARQFFEKTLPAQAASEVHRLFASTGSIAFKVGPSAWTFRFGSVEPIEPRFDRDADLHLWFTPPAFAAFVDGTLNVAKVAGERAGEGAIKARGDLRLLERFGRFLQPDDALLGWSHS